MVTKHFQDLQQRELRAEREDVLKMKRIAGTIAKMVREFWSNIEKVCWPQPCYQSSPLTTRLKYDVAVEKLGICTWHVLASFWQQEAFLIYLFVKVWWFLTMK